MKRKHRHSFWVAVGTVATPTVALFAVVLQNNRPSQPIVINVNGVGPPSQNVSHTPTKERFDFVANNPFAGTHASFLKDNPW